MAYQPHYVKIRKEDRNKADAILEKHWLKGDLDDISASEEPRSDGGESVIYRICPYICEDLGVIVDEFKQEGIQVL